MSGGRLPKMLQFKTLLQCPPPQENSECILIIMRKQLLIRRHSCLLVNESFIFGAHMDLESNI